MFKRRLAVSGLALLAAAPALAQDFDLGTIVVDAEAGGFVGSPVELSTGTLLKSGTDIAETPRSVSIVTAQDIYERGAADVEDALSYTTGVASHQFGLDDRSDWYTIRGFRPTTFHDGLQARYGFYNDSKPEPFLLNSIQVLRGPASGLYGNSEVAGVVNTESKTAANYTGENLVRLSYSDPRSAELGLDFGGSLNQAGTLSYRFVGLVREGETQVDFSQDDALAFAPSITWAPTPDTSLTLLYNRQRNDGSPLIQFASLFGTLKPAPNGRILEDDLFIGEPGFDKFESRQDSLTLFADHRISNIWSVTARARYLEGEANYNHAWWAFDNFPTRYNSDGTINRTFYRAENNLRTFTFDAYATADWGIGGWNMQTVFGANFADAEYDSDTGFGSEPRPIDPFNPEYTGAPEINITDSPANYVEEWGVYAQNRATLNDRLHLDFGLRYANIETGEATGTFRDSAVEADDDALSANFAVLYEFANGMAPYVSYAESFRQELAGSDVNGNPFEPTRGKQYELGLKYQPTGTNHLYSVALFDLEKSNLTIADPNNPGFQVQTGRATSQGLELSAQRQFGDFRIDASATFLDTENENGFEISNTPDRLASIWGTWAPSGGRFDGLTVGVGLRHSGEKWDGTDTQRTPAYTLVDARLAYQWDNYEAAVNVSNLGNKQHVTFCGTATCYFGKSRTVTVSLATKF